MPPGDASSSASNAIRRLSGIRTIRRAGAGTRAVAHGPLVESQLATGDDSRMPENRSLPPEPWPVERAAARIATIFAGHGRSCAVTMGVFDGVHMGHRVLINRARRAAREAGLPLVAVTFSPRPDQVLRPGAALPDLCPLQTRLSRLRDAGAEDVVVLPFSRSVAGISAERFARLLLDDLGMRRLCVGADFAIGRDRVGTVDHLRKIGVEVETVPFVLSRSGEKVSSSTLRRARASSFRNVGAQVAASPGRQPSRVSSESIRSLRLT